MSEVKLSAGSVPGESAFLGLQSVTLLLCPHMSKRGSSGLRRSSSSYNGSKCIAVPTHMTSVSANYLPKSPSPNATSWWVMASTYEFGGNRSISSITEVFNITKY